MAARGKGESGVDCRGLEEQLFGAVVLFAAVYFSPLRSHVSWTYTTRVGRWIYVYGGVKVCLNYSSQQCMELVRSFRKTFSPSLFSFWPNLRRCRSTHSTNLHHGLQMQTRKCLTDDDRPFSYIMRLLFLFCSGLWSAA